MAEPASTGMLDEPSLSRQWMARRLQRALVIDTAGAALRRGIAAGARSAEPGIRESARAAEHRAKVVAKAINEVGSEPYSSLHATRFVASAAGRVVGILGPWSWRSPLRRLAARTLSEYDALVDLADDAPGVPPELAERLRSLLAAIEVEIERQG